MTPLTKVPSVQGGVGGGACGGQTRAWPGCQGVERQGPLLGLTPKGSLTMQPRAPQARRRGCGRGQGVQLGPGALPPLRPLRPPPCPRQSPHLTCSLLYLCFTSRRIYPHRAWQACLSPPPPHQQAGLRGRSEPREASWVSGHTGLPRPPRTLPAAPGALGWAGQQRPGPPAPPGERTWPAPAPSLSQLHPPATRLHVDRPPSPRAQGTRRQAPATTGRPAPSRDEPAPPPQDRRG